MTAKIVKLPDGYYVLRGGGWYPDGPYRSWFRAWLSWLFS